MTNFFSKFNKKAPAAPAHSVLFAALLEKFFGGGARAPAVPAHPVLFAALLEKLFGGEARAPAVPEGRFLQIVAQVAEILQEQTKWYKRSFVDFLSAEKTASGGKYQQELKALYTDYPTSGYDSVEAYLTSLGWAKGDVLKALAAAYEEYLADDEE